MERAAKSKPGKGKLGVGRIALQVLEVGVVGDNRVMDTAGIAASVDKGGNNWVGPGARVAVDRVCVDTVPQVGVREWVPVEMVVQLLLEGLVPVPAVVVVEVLKGTVFDPAYLSSFADDWFSHLHPLLSQPKSDWDILSLSNRVIKSLD